MPAKIEILSVDLLDKHHPLVNDLRSLANSLGLEFGWHYLLDLVWIISQLSLDKSSLHILDAGAGVGVMQWYLAERGAHVISVDRIDRVNLSLRFRGRY
jgi:2-polyprenyl-3-methyl-5-hydroxy-6-metoxy-1,4-benzoquinol methylase